MEWIIWLIVIVLIIAIVWWLMNRNNSGNDAGAAGSPGGDKVPSSGSTDAAGTAGMDGAAGSSRAAEPEAPTTAENAGAWPVTAEAADAGTAANGATKEAPASREEPASDVAAGDVDDWAGDGPATDAEPAVSAPADNAGREDEATSMPGGPAFSATREDGAGAEAPVEAVAAEEAPSGMETIGTPAAQVDDAEEIEAARTESAASTQRAEEDKAEWETQWSEAGGTAPAAAPAHHAEYTVAHAPTLPGAESAAAEAGFGELDEGAEQGSAAFAASGTASSQGAEPTGHLAVERPYGEGSAAPAADGSGPEGYAVKGNAGSMTYHDESSPAFEETQAEVWFESVAHAEAAGFRAPRRTRP